MQVRAGDPAGAPGKADKISPVQHLTFFDRDLRQVHIRAENSQAVVNNDVSAGIVKITRQDDLAVCHTLYRRAFGGPEIYSQVGISRLAVEDPAQPVFTGDDAGSRSV